MFVYLLLRRMLCLDENVVLSLVSSSNKKILDLGCGYGYVSYLLAKKFPDSQVIGVDTNSFRISQANQNFKLKNLNFFVADATKLNFKNKFDIILAIDLFHHIPSEIHNKILGKVSKHLIRGGIFILRDISKSSSLRIFNTIHDLIINRCFCVNYKFFLEWKKILLKFNLEIDKKIYLPKLVYSYIYIVSSKK